MAHHPPIQLAKEFVFRAGIADEFIAQSMKVESALRSRMFPKARLELYKFFLMLAQGSEEDISEEPNENIPSFVYWNGRVGQLKSESPQDSFRLAVKCISAIEDFMFLSEDVQVCAYSAVLSSAEAALAQSPSARDSVCDALKNVMMRSSEFVLCSVTREIFDLAADKFLKVLELYPPSERYNQIFEMSVWLGTRKIESPYLQAFVDEVLSTAEEYENGVKYIPDDILPDAPAKTVRPSYLKLVHSSPT